MITVITQFAVPAHVNASEMRGAFTQVAPAFRNVPHLLRKQFLLSPDGRTAGGVYLWENEAAARTFMQQRVAPMIREQFRVEPTIEFYDSPVLVDQAEPQMVAGQAEKPGQAGSNSASGTAFAGRPNPSAASRELVSTKDVIDHHLKCFGELDLEGVLSDYAPDAVMFTANGVLRGVDEIRPLFHAMIAEFEKPGATFHLQQQSVAGDHAYILWNAETADNVYELGTDTFVVIDGKIVAQSYTSKIVPKA